jgi:membrane protease YdiL (CAAX protease family)
MFAIPEEILFRGFVQTQIGDYYNSTITVLVASLVFGLAHLFNAAKGITPSKWNWNLIALATIGGIPLGSLFIITESLFYPIILHALFLIGLQSFIKEGETTAKTKHILTT